MSSLTKNDLLVKVPFNLLGAVIPFLVAIGGLAFFGISLSLSLKPLLYFAIILISTSHFLGSLFRSTHTLLPLKAAPLSFILICTLALVLHVENSLLDIKGFFWVIGLYLPMRLHGIICRKIPLEVFKVALGLYLWITVEFSLLHGFLPGQNDLSGAIFIFWAVTSSLYLFNRELLPFVFSPCLSPKLGINKANFFWLQVCSVSLLGVLVPFGLLSGFFSLKEGVWQLGLVPKFFGMFIGIYFINALPEELLFRGLFQDSLKKLLPVTLKRPELLSLLLTSLFFGFCHLNNYPLGDWRWVVSAAIAGLFYGGLFIKTGNITLPAGLHAGTNTINLLLFNFSQP